jgi:hypothetical protein
MIVRFSRMTLLYGVKCLKSLGLKKFYKGVSAHFETSQTACTGSSVRDI